VNKRIERIHDRFLMRTSRIGQANQALCCLLFVTDLFAESSFPTYNGRYLYEILPQEWHEDVINSNFDPYNTIMSESEMFKWLWDHVIFDPQGYMIALYNHGQILLVRNEWLKETEWFGRVKQNQWLKRDRRKDDV
jgi:hypothetical protein